MKFRFMLVVAALAMTAAQNVHAVVKRSDAVLNGANSFIRGGALPKWSSPLADLPITERTDPVVLRVAEAQQFVGEKQVVLISRALQVNDHAALGEIGQYSIEYFPAYQKMQLHRVFLLRDGKTIDRTATVNTRLLQRETGLEQGMYAGATTVQLLVDDVRVGDTLWVVYSVEGSNPVFGSNFAQQFSLDSNMPIELRRLTVLHPKQRPLQWKQLGDLGGAEVRPVIDEINGMTRLRFEDKSIAATEFEPSTPNDFLPIRMISMSEYKDWAGVANWATTLFPKPKPSTELTGLVRQFSSQPNLAAQASAALQWVQNEVRYFSVSIGENSHRPQPPETVIKRRYGDCKDKSYLLVSLLQALGIEAHPVLLSATSPRLPSKVPPSPAWFDHVIVQILLDGKIYYVDPTRTGQSSPLDRIDPAVPGAAGLVVDTRTTALTVLPERNEVVPLFEQHEHVSIDNLEGDVSLETHFIYRNRYAEWARLRFPKFSANELNKDMLAEYEKEYQGVQLQGKPVLKDEPQSNLFEVVARYSIPKAVELKDGIYKFHYETKLMTGTLGLPDKLVRKAPFSLPQGKYWGRYRLLVNWPPALRREGELNRTFLDNAFFQASDELTAYGNTIDYLIDYRIKADTVAAKDLPELNTVAKKLSEFSAGSIKLEPKELATADFITIPLRQLDEARTASRLIALEARLNKNKVGTKIDKEQLLADCDELSNVQSLANMDVPERTWLSKLASELKELDADSAGKACAAKLYFSVGEYAKSLPLFEAKGELKEGDPSLRQIAWARVRVSDKKGAVSAIERYVAGVTHNVLEIADVIALYQRAGQSLPDSLQKVATSFPDGPWPRAILAMQVGLITPQALIEQAEGYKGDKREIALNDAWYYVAQYHLSQGNKEEARLALHWFLSNGIRSLPYYLNAKNELSRLEKLLTVSFAYSEAMARKDLASALAVLQKEGEAGDRNAQFNLGEWYYHGKNGKVSFPEALHWYELAAEQGLAIAQNMVGIMYSQGEGQPIDGKRATAWLEKASAQGYSHAQYNLGSIYLSGEIMPRDEKRAIELIRLAAEQGHPDAQADLAEAYTNGTVVPKSQKLALMWALRGAAQKNGPAMWRAGWLYRFGDGIQDPKLAFAFFKAGAALGNTDSMNSLGNIYELGQGVDKDLKQSVKWYKLAAEKGNYIAQYNLGKLYQSGTGVTKDLTIAAKWYKNSADMGYPDAQYAIGYSFLNGEGVPKDVDEATKWYRLSAEHGLAIAQESLGDLYSKGLDVQKDLSEALKWYRRSAAQGNIHALNNLGEMYRDGQGVPTNRVVAYAFFNLSSEMKTEYQIEQSRSRTAIAEFKSPEEIAAGKALAIEFAKDGNLLNALDKYLKNAPGT